MCARARGFHAECCDARRRARARGRDLLVRTGARMAEAAAIAARIAARKEKSPKATIAILVSARAHADRLQRRSAPQMWPASELRSCRSPKSSRSIRDLVAA